jgi:hypothetical protein
VAKQWVTANTILLDVRHDTPNVLQLGAALVHPCLKYFLKQWIERNATLHGGTKEEQENKQQVMRNAPSTNTRKL